MLLNMIAFRRFDSVIIIVKVNGKAARVLCTVCVCLSCRCFVFLVLNYTVCDLVN